MSKFTQISLRQGERVFINGAVIRADRRVIMEVMNDVPYLLEHQILQAEDTTTPLRQLYFILQTMIFDPAGMAQAKDVFYGTNKMFLETFSNAQILDGLRTAAEWVGKDKPFEALKIVRSLMPIEDMILGITRHEEIRYLEAV